VKHDLGRKLPYPTLIRSVLGGLARRTSIFVFRSDHAPYGGPSGLSLRQTLKAWRQQANWGSMWSGEVLKNWKSLELFEQWESFCEDQKLKLVRIRRQDLDTVRNNGWPPNNLRFTCFSRSSESQRWVINNFSDKVPWVPFTHGAVKRIHCEQFLAGLWNFKSILLDGPSNGKVLIPADRKTWYEPEVNQISCDGYEDPIIDFMECRGEISINIRLSLLKMRYIHHMPLIVIILFECSERWTALERAEKVLQHKPIDKTDYLHRFGWIEITSSIRSDWNSPQPIRFLEKNQVLNSIRNSHSVHFRGSPDGVNQVSSREVERRGCISYHMSPIEPW
jgi:hypothetical protein